MTEEAPRPKVRKKRAKPSPLDEGDIIEYSMTASLKVRGSDYWIKTGGQTTIREGETAAAARSRLKDFVFQAIEEDAQEILEA